MGMGARMAMPIDPGDHIAVLTQWLSPAYPVGGYSYSHGLEWAVEAGQVHDRATLSDWLETVLCHGTGRCDALVLAAAHRAPDRDAVTRIDATARAFAGTQERLNETLWQGAAFGDVTRDVYGLDLGNWAYPVAVGHAAAQVGLDRGLSARMYLQAMLCTLAGAGMRLSVVGQTAGQGIIRDLLAVCGAVAQGTDHGDLDDLAGTALMAEIAAMKHETQYSRIFRT